MCLLYNFDLLVYLMLFLYPFTLGSIQVSRCSGIIEMSTLSYCSPMFIWQKIRIHPFYKIHVYVIAFYVIYITVHVFMKILIRVRTSKLFLISIDMKLNLIKSNFFTICNFFFNSKFKKKNVIYILSSDMFNVVSKHLFMW